ncbi:MAG TPA: hypothetical protein VE643_08240 [Nitrososphaeraceae archaeon]|nr:hypothetical protein [Nitrososphaeraceae archaeon]
MPYKDQIVRNIFHNILSNPLALSLEIILVPLVIFLMIKQKMRGKGPAVV